MFQDLLLGVLDEKLALAGERHVKCGTRLTHAKENLMLGHVLQRDTIDKFEQVLHANVQVFEALYVLEVSAQLLVLHLVPILRVLAQSLDHESHVFGHVSQPLLKALLVELVDVL